MPKEIWSTDGLGFPSRFKARIEDDGSVWEVDAWDFRRKWSRRFTRMETSGKSMGWDCQVDI